MFRAALFALPLTLTTPAFAADAPPAMASYIEDELKAWINDAQIVAGITAQNATTSDLSEDEIIARDNVWRGEVGASDTPMIDGVVNTPLAGFLRDHVEKSQGRITEVFVMDSRGLNVASSGVTSDYWQGDEAKFQKTYDVGSGAVFVDEIELDESTQTYQGQASFAITDPASGAVIGAITVGLNAEAFF